MAAVTPVDNLKAARAIVQGVSHLLAEYSQDLLSKGGQHNDMRLTELGIRTARAGENLQEATHRINSALGDLE